MSWHLRCGCRCLQLLLSHTTVCCLPTHFWSTLMWLSCWTMRQSMTFADALWTLSAQHTPTWTGTHESSMFSALISTVQCTFWIKSSCKTLSSCLKSTCLCFFALTLLFAQHESAQVKNVCLLRTIFNWALHLVWALPTDLRIEIILMLLDPSSLWSCWSCVLLHAYLYTAASIRCCGDMANKVLHKQMFIEYSWLNWFCFAGWLLRSSLHWQHPWDLMVPWMSMSQSSRPTWCHTQEFTSCCHPTPQSSQLRRLTMSSSVSLRSPTLPSSQLPWWPSKLTVSTVFRMRVFDTHPMSPNSKF